MSAALNDLVSAMVQAVTADAEQRAVEMGATLIRFEELEFDNDTRKMTAVWTVGVPRE